MENTAGWAQTVQERTQQRVFEMMGGEPAYIERLAEQRREQALYEQAIVQARARLQAEEQRRQQAELFSNGWGRSAAEDRDNMAAQAFAQPAVVPNTLNSESLRRLYNEYIRVNDPRKKQIRVKPTVRTWNQIMSERTK